MGIPLSVDNTIEVLIWPNPQQVLKHRRFQVAFGGFSGFRSVSGRSLFRFSKHPKLAPKIEEMKGEIVRYNQLPRQVNQAARAAGLDSKEKDTFKLSGFWRANGPLVSAFSHVLRAVLSNAPNSIPLERIFSILNNSFDDDHDTARTRTTSSSRCSSSLNERSRSHG